MTFMTLTSISTDAAVGVHISSILPSRLEDQLQLFSVQVRHLPLSYLSNNPKVSKTNINMSRQGDGSSGNAIPRDANDIIHGSDPVDVCLDGSRVRA